MSKCSSPKAALARARSTRVRKVGVRLRLATPARACVSGLDGVRVLVVDDMPHVLGVVTEILKGHGATVTAVPGVPRHALTGSQGIRRARKKP